MARLILQGSSNHLLRCKIASGEHRNKDAMIPHIELSCNDGDFPFSWKGRQFSVRPAFATTINEQVGVWLNDACFTHGHYTLRVGDPIHGVGDPTHLTIAVNKTNKGLTRNVVFKEVL